jgi:hypothetical protein
MRRASPSLNSQPTTLNLLHWLRGRDAVKARINDHRHYDS